MAVSERKRCCFQWKIYSPFMPREELEAAFYFEHPFKVIFEPMNRSINSWEFSISLAYNAMFDPPPDNVVVYNVEVTMQYGVQIGRRTRLGDYRFSRGHQYWNLLQRTVVMGDLRNLSITVEFDITPKINVTNYSYDYMNLLQLSEDIKKLLNRGENTDLVVWSADKHLSFKVHSYILDFRWPYLHKIHQNTNEIETNISKKLFKNVVKYMYSGDFPKISPFVSSPHYSTELCQVVDRYKLDHLYKVLVKDDLKQRRVTINQVCTRSHVFPLRIVENRAMIDHIYNWMVRLNLRGRYEIFLRLQVGNEIDNWLSYTLQLRCQSKVYVEVYLEVVKRREASTSRGMPETTSFPFDVRYQEMLPDQTMASGPVLFLGSPEIFGDSGGAEFNYAIHCHLKVSRGRMLQQLKSVDTMRLRDKKQRYEMLSDHMHQLLNDRRKANMIFTSPPTRDRDTRIIHKELFKIRVPNAWTQIHNAKERYLPDLAICNIDPYAIPYLVEYIYTGRFHIIPAVSIEAIKIFADQTGIFYLRKLVETYVKQRKK